MKGKIVIFLTFLLISCNEEKSDILSLNTFPKNSSESFLLSTKNNLFISWTEQVADTNFLYISKLEDNSWSQKSIIKKGTDWFVNGLIFHLYHIMKFQILYFHFIFKKAQRKLFHMM